jgi:hypothetical protein
MSKKGEAPVNGAKKTTVVVILGEDPLTSRILGLLLAGAGYEVRTPGTTAVVLEDPSAALAGVDLVLLVPGLGDERKGELLGAIKCDPATAAVPVVNLSSVLKDDLDERTYSVPWPWSTEDLVRAIEQAVLAPGGCEARRR